MKHERKIAAVLAAMMVTGVCATSLVGAAEPTVTSDEALYVNLDHYGRTSNVSVVKSYALNGNHEIVDYGDYDEIINMTNYSEPNKGNGKVTFQFDQDVDRFYFEGKMKEEQISLPWSFDVSYSLNGAPIAADKLAGASGLVEVSIHAIPNETTSEYFKNNVALEMATAVDADKVNSVEAPGAQLQSLGNKKVIIFMAMPGEEQTFTIRIGSDDFEFAGVMMMMVPVTLTQLDDISELKDAKDTVQDSADAASNSADVILSTLNGLQGGLNTTINGLDKLDDARATISSGKGEVYNLSGVATEDLKTLANALDTLSPHLDTTKNLMQEMNGELNSMVGTLQGLTPQLESTKQIVNKVQGDVDGLKAMIEKLKGLNSVRNEDMDDLSQQLDDLQSDTEELRDNMDDLDDVLYKLEQIAQMLPTMDHLPIDTTTVNPATLAGAGVTDVVGVLVTLQSMQGGLNGMSSALNGDLDKVNGLVSVIKANANGLIEPLRETTENLHYVLDDASEIIGSMDSLMDTLDTAMDTVYNHTGEMTDLMTQLNVAGDTLNKMIDIGNRLIDHATASNDILNRYEPDMEQSCADLKASLNTATSAIDDLYQFINSFVALAKQSGQQLDAGTQKTLQGLMSALQQSIKGLAQTDTLQNAKDTIKDTIDDEWDKYSEDMHILDIDTSLEPTSFTSDSNPSPSSIQVVLRTEEITKDSEDEDGEDPEAAPKNNGSVLSRIADIFKKIWNGITGIFSD